MYKERQRRPCQRPRQSRLQQCCLRSCCCSVVYGLFTNQRGRLSRTNFCRHGVEYPKWNFSLSHGTSNKRSCLLNSYVNLSFSLNNPILSFRNITFCFSITHTVFSHKNLSRTITPDPCAARERGASRTIPVVAGHLPGSHRHLFPSPPTWAAAVTAAINPATKHARTCGDDGVNGPARAAGWVWRDGEGHRGRRQVQCHLHGRAQVSCVCVCIFIHIHVI
jgi:hypothetical protein